MKKPIIDLEKAPIQISLRNEFIKAFPPFLIYLATAIIWLSFIKDLVRVGYHTSWLFIRLGYLPFILIVWRVFKDRMQVIRFYEIPIWLAGIYIAILCAYFSVSTGGLNSDYIFGIIQFCFAIAVMPLTAITFYLLSITTLVIYILFNLINLQHHIGHHYTMISTVLPLILFSAIVYFITSRIRQNKNDLHNQLSKTLNEMDKTIQFQTERLAKIETESALGLLAIQMAHDIRSPLSALNMIIKELSQLPEDLRILTRSAIVRINDIANNLLKKYKQQSDELTSELVPELISDALESVISEKRAKIYNHNIKLDFSSDCSAYGVFAAIHLLEFKTMVSNLIDNAIEAITKADGRIWIRITANCTTVIIEINDNGCGISNQNIKKLLQEQFTTKQSGLGLGLLHAKKTMMNSAGEIDINSFNNKGATVTLKIPRSASPKWFASQIRLHSNSFVVVVDDDHSIANIWIARLDLFVKHHNIKIVTLHTIDELIKWHHTNANHTVMYLCDYEFVGQRLNGIEVIKKLNIVDVSFLVTSHYENKQIRKSCEAVELKMIPKNFSAYIPISIHPCSNANKVNHNLCAVLIDDDPMVHSMWQLSAFKHNKEVQMFTTLEEFRLKCDVIPQEASIYIDSNLGNGIKGENVSENLYIMGYKNIYLMTGEEPSRFGKIHWLKGIISKDPPWERLLA